MSTTLLYHVYSDIRPTRRRRFDPSRGPRCIESECTVKMMTFAPWPVGPEMPHEGVTYAPYEHSFGGHGRCDRDTVGLYGPSLGKLLFEIFWKTHGPMTDFPKYGRFGFRNIPFRVQVIAIRRNRPRTRFAG